MPVDLMKTQLSTKRIAKTIAESGICSRRQAEKLITLGKVFVNDIKIITPAFFVNANDKIMASFSPAGFAIKLPAGERKKLIQKGRGVEFRFFPDGPIKKEYVRLKESVIQDEETFQELFRKSVGYVKKKAG